MAANDDVNDILEIFLYDNLANITNDRHSIRFPIGLNGLIRAAVIDHVNDLAFPADFHELLVEYVLVRERGDYWRLGLLQRNRVSQGIKKQRREFFR